MVTQVIAAPFSGPANLLRFHLALVAGRLRVLEESDSSVTFLVFDAITVTWTPQMVRIKVSVKHAFVLFALYTSIIFSFLCISVGSKPDE